MPPLKNNQELLQNACYATLIGMESTSAV